MISLEDRKQLDDILLDEANVKVLSRRLCGTEKGELCLDYSRKERRYYITLDTKEISAPKLLDKALKTLHD